MSTQRVRVRPYSYADRLLTPWSLSAIVLMAGGLVAFVADRVAALAMAGVDADPLLQLVATLITGATTTGTLIMQILNRAQSGRVEAEAGAAARILREAQERQLADSAAGGTPGQAA